MSHPIRSRVQSLSLTRLLPRARLPLPLPLPPQHSPRQTRCIQIRAAPSRDLATDNGDNLPIAGASNSAESTDARFDVIGAPYSLLSVTLSASQNLYTRRGTLVGLSGKADNVISTLSVLEPFRRAPVGVPFLYQKISSATPVSALVAVRSPLTSFNVVHLNGSVDWVITQRRALLAWTGRSLRIRPTVNSNLNITHWGNSEVTGRGLLALVGNGQLYSIELKEGEQYIAHPSNVVAYTVTSNPPRPYRFKSSTLNFQVPGLKNFPKFLQETKFLREMSTTETWKKTMQLYHKLRTYARMTIWGDRLFLQFDGPTTILVQSRGPRLNDIISEREVNELADTPRGITADPARSSPDTQQQHQQHKEEESKKVEEALHPAPAPSRTPEQLKQEVEGSSRGFATVGKEGNVEIEQKR